MRAKYDALGIGLGIALATPGSLMMAFGFIGIDTSWQVVCALAAGLGVPAALWFGFARGTYITIDEEKNLTNTVFWCRQATIPLARLVSLNVRKGLGGLCTFVFKTYHGKDDNLVTRGLVVKEMVRRDDFRKLIEAISSANPSIEIPKELLGK